MQVKLLRKDELEWYWDCGYKYFREGCIFEYNGKKYLYKHSGIASGYKHGDGTKRLERLPEDYEIGEQISLEDTDNTIDFSFVGLHRGTIPEELQNVYTEEITSLSRKRIAEEIEDRPDLDYRAIIEEADLTEEQKATVQSIMDIIGQELLNDKYLKLTDYIPIIQNLVSISKGESVIVTHTNASYSRPADDLISLSDINKGNARFATSGLHWDHAWGKRDTKPDVFSLQGRRELFRDGTSYLGSYWKQGYSIDMMLDKNGKPYISRNVYESWVNSQHYEGVLDVNLPVGRFDISTGEEGSFKEYNDEVNEKKSAKRDFYKRAKEQAKEQFGLSEKQAKILLDFAGTVSALSLTTDLERKGLSTDQALEMLRKTSHGGMKKVLEEIGMEYPSYKFDVIQRAAETLAYIHTLQENSPNYTPSEIAAGLNVREGEITETIKQTTEMARRSDKENQICEENNK